MSPQITKDDVFQVIAPEDFSAQLDVSRYGSRTPTFDRYISSSDQHFWDPMNADYIDFSIPFDMENSMMVSERLIPALQTDSVSKKLHGKDRIFFVNEVARWILSSILHGEQGAMALSAGLVNMLKDPGAQEFMANQVREEARHVSAFSRFIQVRWGTPLPAGSTLSGLLTEIVNSDEIYKKIVGMQILVEGLAMGAFATLYNTSNDPLLTRLTQLTMTDEAIHHKFGKVWAEKTIPHLSSQEHNAIEDWAASCFQRLLLNLINPAQMIQVYERFDLDWQIVAKELLEIRTDDYRRRELQQSTNIFRVLIKTLQNANIITNRTRHIYSAFVDLDELHEEGDQMVGEAIAQEGMHLLQAINIRDRVS